MNTNKRPWLVFLSAVERLLLFAFIYFMASCSVADERRKPIIYWAKYQLQPVFISSGEYNNQGMGDRLFSIMQQHLPSFQHQNYHTNVKRMYRDITKTKTICSTLTQKSNRNSTMLFSDPVLAIPTPRLIFDDAQSSPWLNKIEKTNRDDISLSSLLERNPSVKIGINKLRSCGRKINTLIARYPVNFVHFDDTVSSSDLVEMLAYQRIDFTIEYPFVISFEQKISGNVSAYKSLGLSEFQPLIPVYIICGKNEIGQKVILLINEMLLELQSTQQFRQIVEDCLPDNYLATYRSQYQQFLAQ